MSTTATSQPWAPFSPDFHVCDQVYGDLINSADCLRVLERFPRGNTPIAYTQRYRSGGLDEFPIYESAGGCQISLELAGPGVAIGQIFMVANDHIREMVEYIIDECITGWGGVGGFVTDGFANMVNHVSAPGFNFHAPFPTFSSFLTVTVSGIRQDPAPGDDNPLIPLALGQQLADKEKDSKGKAIGTTLSSEFFEISAAMNAFKADREAPSWWDYRPESQVDEMTYECDTKLGSPRSVDCSKLEYSQLGAGSDTIQISPQVPRILSTGTCQVAITSKTATAITWDAIRAALETLVNSCIINPYHPSIGGKAYYGHHIVPQMKRKRENVVSGLIALTPNVTISVYQQGRLPQSKF